MFVISQRKGPAAVSSAAEPGSMSPAATAWLLHAMAPVPVHHATHAAYRVPANIDNALLGTGGSGRNWAERRCRSRRSQGGSERGQQSRGDHRYAQGTFPLVRPPEQWRLAKAQPPSDGSGVEITKGSGLNVAGASAAMAGTHEHPRPLGKALAGSSSGRGGRRPIPSANPVSLTRGQANAKRFPFCRAGSQHPGPPSDEPGGLKRASVAVSGMSTTDVKAYAGTG